MLKLFLSFLSGPLASVSEDLKEAYQAKLKAENDASRIAADERIALLEARKSSILASQSGFFERFIRPFYALPFLIYNFKVVVIDKVLGWGTTDPLSPELLQLSWIILGGYFLDSTVRGTARILKR